MAKKKGLELFFNLLLKDAAKESGKRSGIAQIGNVTRDIAEKKFQAFVLGARKQGVDLDNYTEQQFKYIIQLNKPKSPKVISADSPRGKGITEALLGKRGQVIEGNFGKPFAEEMVTTERVITDIKKMKPMDSMLEANKVLKGEGKYKNLSQADREKIVNDESVTDHIFERDVPIDPEDMATGGRVGLKDGMSRRKFLKIAGGLAALPIVGKFFKGAKIASKVPQVVTTPSVAGKPAWFDSLVNKVIAEGEDVTKKFATKDREIVHATKVDDDAMVTVYRDLDDGTVRVDIDDATTNVMDEQGNAIVSMEFKPGMADETTKGAKPANEFTAVETDYRNYMDGPDDFVTEGTENTVNNIKDLTADLTKVKMYAKGQKKPTIKEMMIQRDRSKTLKQAEENPAEYAADRGPDVDYSDYDNYASGGLAGMLGE